MRDYTVVIPAYNAAGMIGDALRSVLSQSIPPRRVIVVDDGSTDGTVAEIAGFGDQVETVRQVNSGPGAATTRGFSMVETDFVASVDADDLWVAGKMDRQFAMLESEPGLAGCFGKMADFKGDPAAARFDLAYDGWTRTTMLMRTAAARSAGAVIDPPGRGGEMVDWLARVREAGHRLTMMQEVLALRRVHKASMTNRNHNELTPGYLQVARAAMLRRRARNAEDKT